MELKSRIAFHKPCGCYLLLMLPEVQSFISDRTHLILNRFLLRLMRIVSLCVTCAQGNEKDNG